jgi:hypothetical protein
MGNLMLMQNGQLIDAIISIAPGIDEGDAEQLAERLLYPLSLLDEASKSVSGSSVLTEALGELMRRIAGGLEGAAH